VNCLAVRERLPEHAVASLPQRDAAGGEGHLAWCAACRKESAELGEAAATLAFAAAPVEPPSTLEEDVVGGVQRRARRQSATHRRLRIASAVAVVATIIAVAVTASNLWFGAAVVAGPDAPGANGIDIQRAEQRAQERFQEVLDDFQSTGEGGRFAALVAPRNRPGRGWGFVMLSRGKDVAGVRLLDLDTGKGALPYRVWVNYGLEARIRIGDISSLDQAGAAEMFARVDIDLRDASRFVVRRADGSVALSGPIVSNRG
jgi:hypothetical protein